MRVQRRCWLGLFELFVRAGFVRAGFVRAGFVRAGFVQAGEFFFFFAMGFAMGLGKSFLSILSIAPVWACKGERR